MINKYPCPKQKPVLHFNDTIIKNSNLILDYAIEDNRLLLPEEVQPGDWIKIFNIRDLYCFWKKPIKVYTSGKKIAGKELEFFILESNLSIYELTYVSCPSLKEGACK